MGRTRLPIDFKLPYCVVDSSLIRNDMIHLLKTGLKLILSVLRYEEKYSHSLYNTLVSSREAMFITYFLFFVHPSQRQELTYRTTNNKSMGKCHASNGKTIKYS